MKKIDSFPKHLESITHVCRPILLAYIKFIYSEKATKFCEISTVDLSYVAPIKSTVEILKKFAKFCGLLRVYELYYLAGLRNG